MRSSQLTLHTPSSAQNRPWMTKNTASAAPGGPGEQEQGRRQQEEERAAHDRGREHGCLQAGPSGDEVRDEELGDQPSPGGQRGDETHEQRGTREGAHERRQHGRLAREAHAGTEEDVVADIGQHVPAVVRAGSDLDGGFLSRVSGTLA